jgi:aromatic ring-opening dioxygenase LigB subunit
MRLSSEIRIDKNSAMNLQFPPPTSCCPRGYSVHLVWWIVGLIVANLIVAAPLVSAKIQAAVILPHGDAAWDPTIYREGTDARVAADLISGAAHSSGGHWFGSEQKLDLVFLSSPHGVQLTQDFAMYTNEYATGSAQIGGDLHNASAFPPYTVTLPQIHLAPTLAKEFLSLAQAGNVTGIEIPGDDMVLGWAEVIPLLLVRNQAKVGEMSFTRRRLHPSRRAIAAAANNRNHLILSHPSRRYTDAVTMIPELLRLGKLLFQWLDSLPMRIGILISGDLAHTHEASGPYGYSNASAPFDEAIGLWASDPCHQAAALLQTAAGFQAEALSCGYTGFVLLHGMLCNEEETPAWTSEVLVNRNATYFGMMVACFTRA